MPGTFGGNMQTTNDVNVAILGISEDRSRYSYMAYQRLLENGFTHLVGITPKDVNLPNIKIVKSLGAVELPIHTLTLYVGSARVDNMVEEIIQLKPQRIICNPGTENRNLIKRAQEMNIEVVIGCTLVLLATNQF